MIGGLQGDFGDLDIKYLKQNISKYLKMSVANIGKLQENTATLCKISQDVGRKYREASGEHRGTVQNGCETLRVSAIRGSGYVQPGKLKRPPLPSGVRICPTGEVETPSSPIRHQASSSLIRHQAPDVKYPEKAERRRGDRPRMQGVGTPPPDDDAIAIRIIPSRFPKRTRGTRDHHTRTIAYPIRICCPDTIAYPIRICCPDH